MRFFKKKWAVGRPSGRPFESAARPWPARRESGPEGAGPNAEGRPRPGRAAEMSGPRQPWSATSFLWKTIRFKLKE